MSDISAIELIDFYKADHRSQYPSDTVEVYSYFNPRKSRVPGIKEITWFGLQYVIKKFLIDEFGKWFARPRNEVTSEYKELMESSLNRKFDVEHIGRLHDLGYLPIEIRSLPEGLRVPLQTPLMTIHNTHPDFFWLTNYLETLISAEMWGPCTSATTARQFKENFLYWGSLTGADPSFVVWQGHDFSLRGMFGVHAGMASGAGHLVHFRGTDTVPALRWIKTYYPTTEFIGGSVAATEHSVMCSGDEYETTKRLLTEQYPDGIVSIVADSYDFWAFVTQFLPSIRELVMQRDGKLVIRPDSGTPNKILCGDPGSTVVAEQLGLVSCLGDIFGTTRNSMNCIKLDPHIGAIYGDSIDLKEQELILEGLLRNGYSTDNVVLGIGSYSYQYVTRDTFGFVCKATSRKTSAGTRHAIFKNPKTGGWKKSHRGLLYVADNFAVTEDATEEMAAGGRLQPVFRDGVLLVDTTFDQVRRLAEC